MTKKVIISETVKDKTSMFNVFKDVKEVQSTNKVSGKTKHGINFKKVRNIIMLF